LHDDQDFFIFRLISFVSAGAFLGLGNLAAPRANRLDNLLRQGKPLSLRQGLGHGI